MGIAETITAKMDELVACLMSTSSGHGGGSEADARQFMVGYANGLRAAAAGDLGPRDEYLASVVTAIHQAGMPLSIVMSGFARIATAAGAVLGPEHAKWLADYHASYAEKILELWGAS